MPAIAATDEERAALEIAKKKVFANSRIANAISTARPDLSALSKSDREELVHITADTLLYNFHIEIGRDPKYISFDVTISLNGNVVPLSYDSTNRVINGSQIDDFTNSIKQILRPAVDAYMSQRNFNSKEKRYIITQVTKITSRECARIIASAHVNDNNFKTIKINVIPRARA